MSDPVVTITNGVPTSGTGTITTLGAVVTALGTPMQTSGGSVTANAGTNLNTSALALETGGNLATMVTRLTSLVTGTVLAAGSALVGIFKIGDGTNIVAVKAASTAPAATDPALVVAVSPNSWDTGSGTLGAKTQRVIIDSSQFSAVGQTTKSASAPITIASDQGYAGNVGGITVVPSSTMTRTGSTTPTYASGQLFANSTVAASVVNLSWATAARVSGGSGVIIGASAQKSGNTTTGAAFRIHLFTVAPTYVTNGDAVAMTTVVVASGKGYLGYIDLPTMVGFSDVAWSSGAPDNSRGGLPFVAVAQTLFGLIEVRGGYIGVANEVLTVFLDILQD